MFPSLCYLLSITYFQLQGLNWDYFENQYWEPFSLALFWFRPETTRVFILTCLGKVPLPLRRVVRRDGSTFPTIFWWVYRRLVGLQLLSSSILLVIWLTESCPSAGDGGWAVEKRSRSGRVTDPLLVVPEPVSSLWISRSVLLYLVFQFGSPYFKIHHSHCVVNLLILYPHQIEQYLAPKGVRSKYWFKK